MESGKSESEAKRENRGFLRTTLGLYVSAVLLAVFAGLLTWGYTTIAMNQHINVVSKQAKKDVAAAEQKTAVASYNGTLREVQVLLYQAAVSLEQRNFGSAQEKVKQAGTTLATIKLTGSPADSGLDQLKQGIENVNLDVSADVGAQRSAVISLAQQAGQLVTEP